MADNLSPDPICLARSDLKLTIDFHLGSQQYNLSEIESLEPGHVVRLSTDPDSPIELRCGHQVLGRARLVLVDGVLAVQVASLREPAAFTTKE